mmetsp:Transcript_61395/g.101454  ORF Transcript_61395/g.101454 Transcript_61395/m.101454 type:complete len:207 (+) Transcript_61395:329-949(+)
MALDGPEDLHHGHWCRNNVWRHVRRRRWQDPPVEVRHWSRIRGHGPPKKLILVFVMLLDIPDANSVDEAPKSEEDAAHHEDPRGESARPVLVVVVDPYNEEKYGADDEQDGPHNEGHRRGDQQLVQDLIVDFIGLDDVDATTEEEQRRAPNEQPRANVGVALQWRGEEVDAPDDEHEGGNRVDDSDNPLCQCPLDRLQPIDLLVLR